MKRKHNADRLKDGHIISHCPEVTRLVSRLSKESLITLVLRWLETPACMPDAMGKRAGELLEANSLYREMGQKDSVSKRSVMERMFDYEWARGFNLLQIAHMDLQYLLDHPNSIKWTASRIAVHGDHRSAPSVHPPSFVRNLRSSLGSSVTTHIYTTRHTGLDLVMIRIQLHESLNPVSLNVLPPPKRIFYLAFPTSPHVFHVPITDGCHELVYRAIATSLSQVGCEIDLKLLPVVTRSLTTMIHIRGASRNAAALGAWTIYANNQVDKSPLSPADLQEISVSDGEDEVDEKQMRSKVAAARFGDATYACERIAFQVQENHPQDASFTPTVLVRFESKDVFGELKRLVEDGVIDGRRMPGWMTGEDGVTSGIVSDRKLVSRR